MLLAILLRTIQCDAIQTYFIMSISAFVDKNNNKLFYSNIILQRGVLILQQVLHSALREGVERKLILLAAVSLYFCNKLWHALLLVN